MSKGTFLFAFYSDRDLRRACILRCLNEGGPINDLCFLAAGHLYSEDPHKGLAWAIQAAFCNNVSPYRITPFASANNAAAITFKQNLQYLVIDCEESQMAQRKITEANATGSAFGTFKATLLSAHKRFKGRTTRKADKELFEGLMYEATKGGAPLERWISAHSGSGLVASDAAGGRYLAGLRDTLKRGAGARCFDLECFTPLLVV